MFIGAVQLGIMAACVVLFVPMGMAGWHLSRNKMLFFSVALFITLAVGAHLLPYFPSFNLLSPLHSLNYKDSIFYQEQQQPIPCISLLHEIVYSNEKSLKIDSDGNVSDFGGFWKWEDNRDVVRECGFSKLGRVDASVLLNGSWVVVAGDSQARLFVVSLLGLVLGAEEMDVVKGDLFKRHSDYGIVMGEIGLRLDFVWAPYVTNLTDVMSGFRRNKTAPDVLVMGAGLWDMLHVSSSFDYGVSLGLLRDSLVSLLPVSAEMGSEGPVLGSVSVRSPHLYWLGIPTLIKTMLNTEEKREKMTDAICDAYDQELFRNKVLRQYGGPLLLLDIRSLSQKCGVRCTTDGMHYSGAVYESSVHIMLNALLIESHQKL